MTDMFFTVSVSDLFNTILFAFLILEEKTSIDLFQVWKDLKHRLWPTKCFILRLVLTVPLCSSGSDWSGTVRIVNRICKRLNFSELKTKYTIPLLALLEEELVGYSK
ncbi:hypothetical protein XENTR_v10020964 [Xenopus tropicalis]|nr:hypothetical protein XENTR_v10020964 [Xenopus tropicalis]